MQAVQFLNGLNQLPSKKEAAGLSGRKESPSTSFKSMLEDASRSDGSRKADYAGEAKGEDAPKEIKEAALIRKEAPAEKESDRHEDRPSGGEGPKALAQWQEDFAVAVSGPAVLFGQPVEQASEAPAVLDAGLAGLEDVTPSLAAFDPMEIWQGMEAAYRPEGAQAEAVAVNDERTVAAADEGGLPFEGLLADGEQKEASTGKPEGLPAAEGQPALASAVMPQGSEPSAKEGTGQDGGRQGNKAADRAAAPLAKDAPATESKFTIVDNRSMEARRAAAREQPATLKAESVRQHGSTLDITFNLNQEQQLSQAAQQGILSTSDQAAAGDSSTFQKMFSNQILTQAPEFVKAGAIILRDNDDGTINLNLKPETLGNVKITLHVTDKGIEGQIVVASRQSGFDAATLTLSLSNGSADGGQLARGNAREQQSGGEFEASKAFGGWADGGEKLPSQTIAAAYGAGGHEIDVVA